MSLQSGRYQELGFRLSNVLALKVAIATRLKTDVGSGTDFEEAALPLARNSQYPALYSLLEVSFGSGLTLRVE